MNQLEDTGETRPLCRQLCGQYRHPIKDKGVITSLKYISLSPNHLYKGTSEHRMHM